MATARKVHLSFNDQQPQYVVAGITQNQADVASQLLQKNHDQHHIFFREDGFHNHIVHHLLTICALGASCSDLQKAFDVNKSYQRSTSPHSTTNVRDLHDPRFFLACLGREQYYNDFLEFFVQETERTGWKTVVLKYLFTQDERSESMFARLFLPFLHGIIHVGFGMEFMQPAIVCEGLSQVACHDDWMGRLLYPAEIAARSLQNNKRTNESLKSFVDLLDEVHADEFLSSTPEWTDPNKVRDGIMVRAPDDMIRYLAQVKINAAELDKKTAEMINMVAYFCAGSQHPPNIVMFDFYFMHCMNASLFLATFVKQDWLSASNKVRLLEWKVRSDLAIYTSRRSPRVEISEIRLYQPKQPSGWKELQTRACRIQDDGHAAKLLRSFAHGEEICRPYENNEEFRVKGSDWLQMGHMAVDSTEEISLNGERWVRSAGFEKAWEQIPVRL